jgi:uncharacterized HAD superfamily protein
MMYYNFRNKLIAAIVQGKLKKYNSTSRHWIISQVSYTRLINSKLSVLKQHTIKIESFTTDINQYYSSGQIR